MRISGLNPRILGEVEERLNEMGGPRGSDEGDDRGRSDPRPALAEHERIADATSAGRFQSWNEEADDRVRTLAERSSGEVLEVAAGPGVILNDNSVSRSLGGSAETLKVCPKRRTIRLRIGVGNDFRFLR